MSSFDPHWLNVQYNNRARCPDHGVIFERWASVSATVRERMPRRLDVHYGDGLNERLDIFPATQSNAPVMVFIHGGWWRSLDKHQHSFIAPSFVDAGAMVIVPNYALCPVTTIDAIVLQLVRALVWIYRNAALYGGDHRRIVVIGHGSGGHLAAMLLSGLWAQVADFLPPQLVRAALSISGVFDLEPLRHTPYLKADLHLTPSWVKNLSPTNFPAPEGPLFTVVGELESEEHLRQNSLLRAVWGPKVVPVCEAIAGAHHFTVLHELVDPASHLHRLALELLGLPRARG